MSVTAPETTARDALRVLIQTEFAAEGFPVTDDRLHESVGSDGTRIATSPERSRPTSRSEQVLLMEILVQFYGAYKLDIDPLQKVDPAKIENFAERFRRALRKGDPKTSGVWYFQLAELRYPEDPTGNKSRFEATVIARGNNSALVETLG